MPIFNLNISSAIYLMCKMHVRTSVCVCIVRMKSKSNIKDK